MENRQVFNEINKKLWETLSEQEIDKETALQRLAGLFFQYLETLNALCFCIYLRAPSDDSLLSGPHCRLKNAELSFLNPAAAVEVLKTGNPVIKAPSNSQNLDVTNAARNYCAYPQMCVPVKDSKKRTAYVLALAGSDNKIFTKEDIAGLSEIAKSLSSAL